MKRVKSAFVFAFIAATPIAVGCSVQAPEIEPDTEHTSTSHQAVQVLVDEYVGSLVRHDVATLEKIVSSEIRARSTERRIDLPSFLEKQRAAMMRTFDLAEGEQPVFEVTEVADEGEAVRVTLALRGDELKKPFYFVREDGGLKLNIAPPGFSKSAPDGTLFGRESYAVRNQNLYGNPPVTISCHREDGTAGYVTVAPGERRSVDCDDTCGWWAGSTFWAAYNGPVRRCDWNFWGDDVYINWLAYGGWDCNDYC